MSEYKFSCPSCGQHLAAENAWAGQRIACPACKSELVVPPAPSAKPPPLPPPIPSSSSRPVAVPGPLIPTSPTPVGRRSRPLWPVFLALGLVVAVAVLAGGIFVFNYAAAKGREAKMSEKHFSEPRVSPAQKIPPFGQRSPAAGSSFKANPRDPAVTTNPEVVEIPAGPITGKMQGTDFTASKATLINGILTLGGVDFDSDRIMIFLFTNQESLEKRSFQVPLQGRRSTPHVHLRWHENGLGQNTALLSNYVLRLEFGTVSGNKLPGKLYLELSESYRTKVAGSFEAELRTPQ